jgi:hypothetical protein
MKNNVIKYVASTAMALGLAATVQAIPITGEVDMSGTVTLANGSGPTTLLGNATKATAFTGVTVGGVPTGNFAGSFSSIATWVGFGWSPFVAPATQPLWYFDYAGNHFSFDLTSVTVMHQDNSFLNLLGSGTLKETGVVNPDNTTGAWSFTISNAGGGAHSDFSFTFANSQTAAVPDGGLTVALLGAALSGLALIRRKLA